MEVDPFLLFYSHLNLPQEYIKNKTPINIKPLSLSLTFKNSTLFSLSLSNPMSEFPKSDRQRLIETTKSPEEGDRNKEEEVGEAHHAAVDGGGESCRTPTSLRHRIPAARSCPTTPRKQKVLRKRKFSDESFFEATGRGEVESLFDLFYRVSSSKKRCTSV